MDLRQIIIPTGITASAIAHVALLALVLLFSRKAFAPAKEARLERVEPHPAAI